MRWRSPARLCAKGSASCRSRSLTGPSEIAQLVNQVAPRLLGEPGFGPLTAAKLVGEIAGAQRFSTDAKLARAAGLAPIPVSSANTNRHRLPRGGNRQINAALHRIAVTRGRSTLKINLLTQEQQREQRRRCRQSVVFRRRVQHFRA